MICQWCFEEEAMDGYNICKSCYDTMCESNTIETLDELIEKINNDV